MPIAAYLYAWAFPKARAVEAKDAAPRRRSRVSPDALAAAVIVATPMVWAGLISLAA